MHSAPPTIVTSRLVLRRPTLGDAEAIFTGYAGDSEVTRYMSWGTHPSIENTRGFLEFAMREWIEGGVGAYLIERDGVVIGSTGLHPRARHCAVTGYILERNAWGHGYATEACRRMIELGQELGFERVEAQCHASHTPSARVLEKAGMAFEGVLRKHSIFPNLSEQAQDVRSYAWTS
jgi:RimJ/RimL family protein N-acetyltransferase